MGGMVTEMIEGKAANRLFAELLDQAFGVPAGRRFLDDFPIWDADLMPDGESLARLGAFSPSESVGAHGKSKTLVASAGVRLGRLKATGSGYLKVGMIGAVATHPAYRGQGLASKLVVDAVDWAQKRGAAAVFLWGSEHSFYRRLGFELCGEQAIVPLNDVEWGEFGQEEPLREGWTPALFDVLVSREGGLALEPDDRIWLEAQRSVKWYWIGPAEKPSAYAAVGRGIDLAGLVHEWGGEPRSLKALLGRLKSLHPEASILGSPSILRRFGFAERFSRTEFLCLARILAPREILAAYDIPRANGRTLPGAGQLSRYFFGPDSEPGELSSGSLRLPLWFWGLDAV